MVGWNAELGYKVVNYRLLVVQLYARQDPHNELWVSESYT